jgi:hypothetical protein
VLEIAMEHTVPVRLGEGVGDRGADPQRLARS